jgi:hypothetical protein
MIKIFISGFILLLILIMNSCGPLSSGIFKEQEWSKNYVLEDGVKSTSPEMIDGNMDTVGKMLFPDDFYRGGTIRALPNAEVVITLPEKKSISKIVIYSDNLPELKVYANDMTSVNDNWKLIKEVTNNKLKEIEIRMSVQTNKILVRAKGITPIESTETSRVLGGVVVSRKVFEPEIKEIELYGFKPKEPQSKLWE